MRPCDIMYDNCIKESRDTSPCKRIFTQSHRSRMKKILRKLAHKAMETIPIVITMDGSFRPRKLSEVRSGYAARSELSLKSCIYNHITRTKIISMSNRKLFVERLQ